MLRRTAVVGLVLAVGTSLIAAAPGGPATAGTQRHSSSSSLVLPPAVDLFSPIGTATAAQDGTPRRVSVDQTLLEPGRDVAVRLDLGSGFTPTTTLRAADPINGGYAHWTGVLAGSPGSQVTIIRRGSAVSGLVSAPEGTYTISTSGAGEQVLTKADTTVPDEAEPKLPPTTRRPDTAPSASTAPDLTAAANPVVDVLIAYTPQAATAAGGKAAMEALAALAVAVSNDSFQDSGVALSYNLVGTAAVAGTGGVSETTLDALTEPNDGLYDTAHAARAATGADLVSLFVEGGVYCGIAWYPGSSAWGFSVVARDCAVGNLTFPHELGHNLGASHDRYVESYGYYSYGFGLVNTSARWRTIMAYNNQCMDAGFNCTRIARWSNPTQTYGGAPLGIAAGQPQAADNRSALNKTAAEVAAYRSPVANPAPVLVMNRPATKYALTSTLTATWTTAFAGTGVANVDVRYIRAPYNKAFYPIEYPAAWQRTTASKVVLSNAAPGYTYCFAARARNAAGAVSAWTAWQCTAVALDDRSLSRSAGWTAATNSTYYAGTAQVTTRSGATLTRTNVQAKHIYLIATRCATCGTVGVYWNGTLLKKISLRSASTLRRSPLAVTSFPGVRSGTLTIRSLTAGKVVSIDGVSLSRL